MNDCYCSDHFRKCVHCTEAEERAEEQQICSRWNWNCSPRECAEQAAELGWNDRRIKHAMKTFGFSRSNIDAVLWEFSS